jgi:histidine kinase
MDNFLASSELFFEGMNSLIYFQRESKYNMPVIVKFLKSDEPTIQQITHLNNEYEVLKNRQIDGVRLVLDRIKIGNQPALVLPFFEGDIARLIFQKIPFSLKNFLKIAIRICDIIGNIHQNKIIHCDINNNNILINPKNLEVQIIDFGISSKIDIKVPELNSNLLQGTLAYISPEQTGRMNRSVDYRTDLYSLGVSLYELLTGQLPYQAKDSMEVIYAHIAKTPLPVHILKPTIPLLLSAIVAKLMEKNAENRYQSAFGVKADLEKCLHYWEQGGKIPTFELGENDFSGKLNLVEKLYGREADLVTMLQALDRVSQQNPEILLISGYAGVGKSSLINEIYKYLPAGQNNHFIVGKFEQFQRNEPYSGLQKAFDTFCEYLITLPESELSEWKQILKQVVGGNGKLLTDIIPNLEFIVGKQPEIVEVSEQEAQNRFHLLFQNFMYAINRKLSPFVLFLDDLQWADSASLHLLKRLMTYPKAMSFWLIGAYRNYELDAPHPLTIWLNELKAIEVPITHIQLENLQSEQVKQLIGESLNNEFIQDIGGLSDLIYSKTLGNPFFTNELLKNIYEAGLLKFDFTQKKWLWDIEAIQKEQISANVVELMTQKITKFSPNIQSVLMMASCIGNRFDLKTLMTVYEDQEGIIFYLLWEAIIAGLLLPLDEHYKLYQSKNEIDAEIIKRIKIIFQFTHDRVQQAAYSLVDTETRQQTHLKIARLFYENLASDAIEENIFNLVHHYNLASDLLTDLNERFLLAQLNFKAGSKAKNATAYQSASNYFHQGIDLLPSDNWQNYYEFTFELWRECAISEFLAGNGQNSSDMFALILQHTQSNFDQAQIYFLQSVQVQALGQLNESMDLGSHALSLLGVIIPTNEADFLTDFQTELGLVKGFMKERSLMDLLNEPMMNSEEDILITKILSLYGINAFLLGRQLLVGWSVVKMTNHSLQKGHNEISSLAYAGFGFLACTLLQDTQTGFLFGELGIQLSHKFDNLAYRAKTYHTYVSAIHFTQKPLREGIELERMAMKYGLESGDMQYCGFACFQIAQDSLMVGNNLGKLLEEANLLLEVLKRVSPFILEFSFIPSVYQAILNLLGKTKSYYSFDNEDFSEADFLQKFAQEPNALSTFYMAKMRSLYWFEQYNEAMLLVDKYEMIAQTLVGLVAVPEASFYVCLTVLANYEHFSTTEKTQYLAMIEQHQTAMKLRAEQAPANFLAKYVLIEAEKAKAEQRNWEAIALYEKAIKEAQQAEYLNIEALAHELFAKFWLQNDKRDYVEFHFRRAYYLYKLWGARAKVIHLEERYLKYIKKHLLDSKWGEITGNNLVITNSTSSVELDLYSVIKASQAISKEMIVHNLLDKVLQIAMENAGAETGFLLDVRGDELYLMEKTSQDQQLWFRPLQAQEKLPLSIINFVKRAKQEVVLFNAFKDEKYASDPYIQQYQPKSVLCFPVIRKGKVSLILYLENNLTESAFTVERLIVLKTLSSQMAISIENAILYENLEEKVKERTSELKEKNDNIMASINYAKRIQEVILSCETEIKESFAEYFIIFRPKDIVSGDFYWLKKTPDSLLISAIDCTGHGIPGAFMSLIANTLLNEITNSQSITNPAQILGQLQMMIRASLKQAETENTDGMAICMCEIKQNANNQTFTLTYAGAKRPLYIYETQKPLHLLELKGSRESIGGWQEKQSGNFHNETVVLQKGDTIYLTTDGYIDTTNPERIRFGSQKFKELLEMYGHLPLHDQKEMLLYELILFQQNIPARDDVTIVGIRL